MKRIPRWRKNRVFVTIPDCGRQDTARPTSCSSSWEIQGGQHGFLPKSWSGLAVLASGANSSCSKPAGTQEQGISWNAQGNYAIRTNPLHLSVTTTGGQWQRIFRVKPMLVQQLVWPIPSDCCFMCPPLVKSPFTDKSGFLQSDTWLSSVCPGRASLVLLTPGCLKQMNTEPAQQLQNPRFKSASSDWPFQIWAALLTHKHS